MFVYKQFCLEIFQILVDFSCSIRRVYTMSVAFDLPTDRLQASRLQSNSYFSYVIFLIFNMEKLAQWDSKVFGLNSTDGLDWIGLWNTTLL